MLSDDTRKRLENIVRGVVLEAGEDTCTTARNLLCASFRTSTTVKKDFEGQSIIKKEQAKFLRQQSFEMDWWISKKPDENLFLARGGEAKIYFDEEGRNVIKINDAVYYATWLEFFNSVVIHNLLFPKTAYLFLGFTETNGDLQAVLQQPFITSDAPVDLSDVKELHRHCFLYAIPVAA
jgi:Serine/Threonine/Tyrosine Kinase found in polyvalent proteins